MISVEEALAEVQRLAQDTGVERIPMLEARGRILRESVFTDRDMPPFDRVMMDGIALRSEAVAQGRKRFRVAGMAPAGAPQQRLNEAGDCLEIMTGAVLPEGADAVVRYEDLRLEDGHAELQIDQVAQMQHVHARGRDSRGRRELLQPGARLDAAAIGVCASVGHHEVQVSRRPRVLIVSTGDELVPIDQTPEAHQIRRSNVHQLAAALEDDFGITARTAHLPDTPAAIAHLLEEALPAYELLLFSGGVSKGKFDHLPEVLAQQGVTASFHKVRQRPGKPLWLGQHAQHQTVVFGLPGNPLSSWVGYLRYIREWVQASLQTAPRPAPCSRARLIEEVSFKPALTYFVPVRIIEDTSGQQWARPVLSSGSGDLSVLLSANAFLQLPAEEETFSQGVAFPILPFRM